MSNSSIPFNVFYTRFGLRTPQYMLAPKMPVVENFFFPKNSIHHFIPYDGVAKHPMSDEYFYRDIDRKILVNHVSTLTDTRGEPRKNTIPILPLIREFHNKNKRFRYLEDITTAKDENSLVVINYGFAPINYRYVKSFYTEYYKWWNLEKTVWDKALEIAKVSDRHQFIFMSLPKTLPSISRLNIFSKIFNQDLVKKFNTPEYLFLLEIWKWLSEEYKTNSVISEQNPKILEKINIVYQESGRFIVVNLGKLSSWRKDQEFPLDDQKFKVEPIMLQKQFLRMLMLLMENRSIVETDNIVDEISEDKSDTDVFDTQDGDFITTPIVKDIGLTGDIKETQLQQEFNLKEEEELHESKLSRINLVLDNLDSDLEALEVIEKEKDKLLLDSEKISSNKTESKINPADKVIDFSFFNKDKSPEDRIKEVCDELADDGLMTASEYRRLLNASTNYKNIPSPYKEDQSIDEFSKIDPEIIKITESKKTVDRKTIIDKSMLSSSLLEFDEKYIQKVLPKDVVGMVSAIQKSGVIITKYDVETVSDILGKYEIHSVRIAPIQGQPSTLRFKLPVVQDDGVFRSNNISYRLRKQRGENPIRKITPDRVSLTSYYGKTFVSRSDKKVNDYASWLTNQVMRKGIDNSDQTVINLLPADVFDNTIELPRTYTTMAMSFRGFTSNGFDFMFDYHQRENVFGKDNLQKYEINGGIIIAQSNKDEYIVIDKNNTLYKTVDGALEQLGTLESFLGIDTNQSPVDFVHLRVFGKNIPLVLVLGYMYGLDNLINVLKADVRRVSAGQRLNLQEHEYAVSFSDETLIFSKDDKLATLIFAGFKEYAKYIKNYSVYTFDKPNVYGNVLESNGLGIRYLREIDLMDKLFIDPITKEILIEMNEPVTFRGLIVRGAELLLNDSHPDSLDMLHMRIKGYERFAGAVYTEMVMAIREHNSKSGKKNHPIELNPYAVWKRITQDPSLSLVSDINPIENLKQQEAVTYSGTGGRISRSMTKSSRAYHPNDMGVISESTTDSSDVAINTFTSADPQFVSLRGRTKKFDLSNPNPTALLSTSALLSVGSDTDDPKRVNNNLNRIKV